MPAGGDLRPLCVQRADLERVVPARQALGDVRHAPRHVVREVPPDAVLGRRFVTSAVYADHFSLNGEGGLIFHCCFFCYCVGVGLKATNQSSSP